MISPRPQTAAPTRPLLLLLAALLSLAALPLAQVRVSAPTSTPPKIAPVAAPDFGKLPLSFAPNVGQSDPAVRFQVRGMGGTIFFTDSEVVLALPQAAERPVPTDRHTPRVDQPPRPVDVVRMQFAGVNTAQTIVGAQPLPGVVNYFIGNDPAQWHTNLPTYAGIAYQQLYPGVVLRYDGAEGRLKGTYTVAPDADPAQIAWRYAGADRVSVDSSTGDVVIVLSGGTTLREQAPVAWQTVDGRRVPITARYQIADDGQVRFALGRYDPAHALVIDPTLVFSTYVGDSSGGAGSSIAVDGAGNAYLTAAQPTGVSGGYDVFVAKLNPTGSALLFSTYLGGSGDDRGVGITLDDTGNAYITGPTASPDFPVTSKIPPTFGGSVDTFITKLNPTGTTLLFSTYFGGSGDDSGDGIAVDSAGNAYVTGNTASDNFPTVNPIQPTYGGGQTSDYFRGDGFVVKLNVTGSAMLFSTYLGGSGPDVSTDIALDSAGNAYVTGYTASTNFPIANPLQPTTGGGYADVFVTKLNPTGSALLYSTYLGRGGDDRGAAIAVDSDGNALITGTTTDFPTVNPLQPSYGGGSVDAFVAKLNVTGSALLYSTYLGGSLNDGGNDIAVDATGNAYITGSTGSWNFPTVNPIQPTNRSDAHYLFSDVFVAKLNPAGSALLFGTYLGGSYEDWGLGIAVDAAADNAYVTGWAGSADFPIVNPLPPTGGGSGEAFVAKIRLSETAPVTYTVSGRVASADDAGIADVTVATNTGLSAITATDGAFTLAGIAPGTYTLTPTKIGYIFTPATLSVTVVSGDLSGQDFIAMIADVDAHIGQDYQLIGSELTLTITMGNNGPKDLVGAIVDDPLPEPAHGTTWAWICTATSGADCGISLARTANQVTRGVTLTQIITGTGNIKQQLGHLPVSGSVALTVTGTLNNVRQWSNTPVLILPSGVINTQGPLPSAPTVGRFQVMLPLIQR